MAADSSKAPTKGKPNVPAKPYADFPMFAHQTGRWAKKVRGRMRFYGRWGRTVAGEVIPVDDVEESAAEALAEFQRCWPDHSQGREAPTIDSGEFLTLHTLVDEFLKHKKSRLDNKELSAQSFEDYYRTCAALIDRFGRGRRVDAMRPDDFDGLRTEMAKGCGLVALRNKINLARIVFKFAHDSRLIPSPVDFGRAFDRPSTLRLRAAKNAAGPNMFSRDELLLILAALEGNPVLPVDGESPITRPASPVMLAMFLLGLNAGFGNTDCASLPQSAVNLRSGWIEFPRPKTAIKRRVPIWPETAKALSAAIAVRPDPIEAEDANLCFLTERGTRFVRVQPSKNKKDRVVVINSLARRFEQLLDALNVGQRKGIGFYTLRHVFETIAGGCRDQVAVDAIMGHVDDSMAAEYREGFEDQRLLDAVNYVRDWLWPKPVKKTPARKPDSGKRVSK